MKYATIKCLSSGAFPEQVKRGGIWSEIKSGKIVENGKETLVCVKLYTVRTSAMHLVTEELQLRYTNICLALL